MDGYICLGVDWETDTESEGELDIKLEAVLETETDIEAYMAVYGVNAEYPVDDPYILSPSDARLTSEVETDHEEDTLVTPVPAETEQMEEDTPGVCTLDLRGSPPLPDEGQWMQQHGGQDGLPADCLPGYGLRLHRSVWSVS